MSYPSNPMMVPKLDLCKVPPFLFTTDNLCQHARQLAAGSPPSLPAAVPWRLQARTLPQAKLPQATLPVLCVISFLLFAAAS